MNMRMSRVLRMMRRGEVAVSVKLNLADARAVEIAAMCGYDCIWIDMEHVPNDNFFVENAVRAAKIYDCDVLIRVAKGSYNDFIHPLENYLLFPKKLFINAIQQIRRPVLLLFNLISLFLPLLYILLFLVFLAD